MKNFSNMRFTRLFGIIAILAVIGLVFSCGDEEANPDDQTIITITDLPAGANGCYASIILTETASSNTPVAMSLPRKISGGKVSGEMIDENRGVWAKDGTYYISFVTAVDYDLEDDLYVGTTGSKKNVTIKENTFKGDIFDPPVSAYNDWPGATPVGEPKAEEYGTYKASPYNLGTPTKSVTETVELSKTTFKVYDDFQSQFSPATTQDSLTFTISKWESVTTGVPTGYTDGYKFTGKITATTATTGTNHDSGYIPSNATAPGFTAADVGANGPECYMYIYFKGTAPNITFVRTPFSKTSGSANSGIVGGNNPRVYTKQ